MRLLLQRDVNPDTLDDSEGSILALTAAARDLKANVKIVELLLNFGARMQESEVCKNAAKRGKSDIVALLIEKRADVNEVTITNRKKYKMTALHLAEAQGHGEVECPYSCRGECSESRGGSSTMNTSIVERSNVISRLHISHLNLAWHFEDDHKT